MVDRPGDSGAGTSTPTSIEGDIRYVISQTNQAFYAGSTIQFNVSKTGAVITLSGLGELKISQNTTIIGPGASSLTIDGNAGNVNGVSTNPEGTRVFNITSQSETVSISGLTITDGNAKPAPNNSGNQGGDIFNSGTLTLTNDVVSNGVATGNSTIFEGRGGGIFNAGGGTANTGATLILDNTTVTGNTAKGADATPFTPSGVGAGGGIYNDLGTTLTLRDGSAIKNNQALGGNGIAGAAGLPGLPGGNAGNAGNGGNGGNGNGGTTGGGGNGNGGDGGGGGGGGGSGGSNGGNGGNGGGGASGGSNLGGMGGMGGNGSGVPGGTGGGAGAPPLTAARAGPVGLVGPAVPVPTARAAASSTPAR